MSVLFAEIGPGGVRGRVAVFYPIGGFLHRAGAHVDGDVGLGVDLAAVFDEIVRAELVRLHFLPGGVPATRALLLGADAVLPVIAGGEISAGPAQHGDVQIAYGLQHVLAEAVLVRKGRAGIVDAAVNATTEMLDEIAVDVAVYSANWAIEINLDARGTDRCRNRRGLELGPLRIEDVRRRADQRKCRRTERRCEARLEELAPSGIRAFHCVSSVEQRVSGKRRCGRLAVQPAPHSMYAKNVYPSTGEFGFARSGVQRRCCSIRHLGGGAG